MPLTGWVPVAMEESSVEWRFLPKHCFTHPFFEHTLRLNARAAARTTTIDEALEWAAAHPGMAPSGFIFHMSRCGSTLVAQMLAAVKENRVMSEPIPLDHALARKDPAMLRTMVGTLGQPCESESRYFIKLDCWHIHSYALIRDVFPKTPAIFLYRSPLEVLVSQMLRPGGWTLDNGSMPREQHIACLLAEIMQAAESHAGGLRLVNYTELPDVTYSFFGIEWTPEQLERMRQASRLDAKSPYFTFEDDRASKCAAATDRIRAAAAELAPLYQRLEELRERQSTLAT